MLTLTARSGARNRGVFGRTLFSFQIDFVVVIIVVGFVVILSDLLLSELKRLPFLLGIIVMAMGWCRVACLLYAESVMGTGAGL